MLMVLKRIPSLNRQKLSNSLVSTCCKIYYYCRCTNKEMFEGKKGGGNGLRDASYNIDQDRAELLGATPSTPLQ